jgi:hypothetical protein
MLSGNRAGPRCDRASRPIAAADITGSARLSLPQAVCQLGGLARLQYPGLLALPVSVALRCPLVVLFLAFSQRDFELCPAPFPIDLGGYDRVTAPLYGANKTADLRAMEQQLAGSDWIRGDVRGGREQRRDVGTEQECLAVAQRDVAFFEVDASFTQRLYFPPLKHYARFEGLLKKVFVTRLFVDGDGSWRWAFDFWFCHWILVV